ncbi:MAG: glycosyltransferase family 39 protein [Verrucomicrobiota bacterium]|jgi:4-amino-4-deoxy-L-arabinose transferase-like glycosyltransferase
MQSLLEKLARTPERSILIFSLALLLAGNWIMPLTDRDEVRFAEASREMIQRGDYIVPFFNGNYRFDKPILIYWCQSTSYRIFGENDFAARLPSVLFTAGTSWILVRWGRRIADAKTAFLGGAMFVACLHVAMIGRVATADMAMVFFFTLAVWSGWELTRPEQRHRAGWWCVFYVTLAMGFLSKGPEAYFPLLGIILGRAFRKNDFFLPALPTIAGFVMSLGLMALWGLPAMLKTNGKYWDVGIGEHVIHRSIGVNDSHGLRGLMGFLATMPLYFLTFFVSFFPWSTRVPSTLRRWWPERQRDSVGWYLLGQAAVVFVIFSLVRTKLPHYTMPAFPCIALWLALQIAGEQNISAWFGKRFVGMTTFILVVMCGFFSFVKYDFLTENLWRATKQYVRPETKVGCYGFTEASLVWRFRTVSTNFVTLGLEKDAADFLTNPPPFILVLPTRDVAQLPDTNGLQIQVHGLDIVKLKNWDLTAIVRQ